MSNPRKTATRAAIGIAGLGLVLAAVALGRFRDGAPATPTKPTRTPEAAAARPLRVETLKSTEAPRPLPVARRADPAAAPAAISKSVEPLIDSPEAHLLLSTEQRAPREKSGLALPDRLEILKERDGLVGYSTATYGATIGRGHVDLALSRQIRDLGQARLAYDLVDVRYGSTVLATGGDAAARVSAEDRTVTFARGPVEERYFLRADALEQSFIIRSLPSGRGDLTVTGRVSSNLAPPMAGSAAKLSFTAQGKDVLTVSEAVAIDATGRRRDLDLAYADGKVSITVPADWLAGATAPIVIDPLMGTALTVDSSLTEVVGTVQGVAVRVVDAAYNAASNEWLVVWQEQFGGSAYNFDIYAQRFSAAGVPVGALIPVAVSGAGEYEPAVSWASSVNKYLIAWRHDPADDASDADQFIAGRVYSWDGVAAGSAFTLDDAAGQDFGPSLAFDGTNWLCVYTNVLSATNTNVLGRFVAADGTPGLAVSVDTDADLAASPSVDFTGTTYLIAWQKGVSGSPRSIYARTMNAGGTFLLVAKAVDTSATDCVHPDVCAGGGQFLIVWQQAATAPDNNVVGRLASTSLTFAKNPFNVRATANDQLTPRSAFSVSSALWYVVYSDTTTGARDIYGTRVDTTGKVTGANKLSSDVAAEVKPEIAWNAATDEMLATWLLGDASPYQVKAQRVSMDFIVPPVPGVPVVSPNPHPTGSYTVTWAPSVDGGFSGLSNYDLQRSLNGGTSWTTLGSPVTASFADNVLQGQYLYRVRASDNAGNTSAYSAASAPVVVDPAPPTEPLSLQQYLADGVTPIPVGGSSADGTLVFGAAVHDLGLLDGFEDSNVTLNPMWTVGAGTWAVSTDGSKVVHDGTGLDDFLSTPSTQSSGSWEYRFRFPTIANNANLRAGFYLFLDSAALGGNGYRALVSAGTTSTKTISLYRVDGASETRIAGADANWVPDTAFHVLRVNRGADGAFTLLLDGVVLGSAVENTYSSAVSMGLRHLSSNGNTLRVDWIRMSSAPLARSTVKLQVEVKAVGTAFDGAGLVESPFLASGSTASVSVPVGSGSYHWRARTVDALGATSPFTAFGANAETVADAVVLATTPPAPPTGLIAMAADLQATLTWTGSTGATSYKVKQGTVHGGPYTEVPGLTSSPALVTGLQNDTTYFWVVTAIGPGGESAPSNEASATPQGISAAPTQLMATGGNNQAFLFWTPSPGALTYNVHRGTQSGGPYSPVGTGVVPAAFTDNGAQNTNTYFYVVYAVNGAGTSAASIEASVTPLGPPPVPANFNGTALSGSSIQWTWENVAGESGFRIHDDTHLLKGSVGMDVLTLTETGLPENSAAVRHVHGLYGLFEGGASNAKSKITLVHDATPADFVVTRAAIAQIDVTVTPPLNGAVGLTGVQIERSTDGGPWQLVKAFSKTYVHHDLGLNPSAAYSYRVRFQNQEGVLSQTSPGVAAPAVQPPAAPVNLTIFTQLTSIVVVGWDDVPDAEGFEIHDQNHTLMGIVGSHVTSFTQVGAAENSPNPRHVHATNLAGKGPASQTVSAYTGIHGPLSSDFALAQASHNSISVTVLPPPNATTDLTGCEIQQRVGGTWTTIKPFSNVYSVTDGNLRHGNTYNYRFRYQTGDGRMTDYSPERYVTTPDSTVQSPSLLNGVSQSPSSILWSWSYLLGPYPGYLLKDPTGATIASSESPDYQYLETGLLENTPYTRILNGKIGPELSESFKQASATTLVHAPTASDFTVTAASMSTVNVSVVPPPHPTTGQTGVRIDRKAESDPGWTTLRTLPGVYLFNDAGLRGDTVYQYRIYFRNADGTMTAVSPVQNVTTPHATVGPVAGLTASGTPTAVHLSWTANSEPVLAGYNVYRAPAVGPNSMIYTKLNGALVTGTTFDDTTATPGVAYFYVVRAVDSLGVEGANSDEVPGTIAVPDAPLLQTIQALSADSIRLLFSHPGIGTHTFVDHDNDHVEKGSLVAPGNGVTRFITESGLTENTDYPRHMHATKDGVTGPASATLTSATLVHDALTSDFTVVWNNADNSATITVIPPTNPSLRSTGFVLFRTIGCGGATQWAQLTGQWVFVDTNLNPAIFYGYAIAYVNADGIRSGTSGNKFVTAPNSPPNYMDGSTVSSSSIEWSWGYVGNATSYVLHDNAHNLIATITGGNLSYLETGLQENTSYSRHVHAIAGFTASDPTPTVSQHTLVHQPTLSDFSLTSLSSSQVRITVVPPNQFSLNSTGCEIQRFEGAVWIVVKSFSQLYEFIESGLPINSSNPYRIRYRNATGAVTGLSPTKEVLTGPLPPPSPTGLTGVAQSTSSIQWSWDSLAGENGFELHDAAHLLKAGVGTGVLSTVETGLGENALAVRHLHGVNAGGLGTASSDVPRYTLVHDAMTGDFLVRSASDSAIDVFVIPPPLGTSGLTGCMIERSSNGVDWSTAKDFSNLYTFRDSGLAIATPYSYRITFRNGDGIVGLTSPSQQASTLSLVLPIVTTQSHKTRNRNPVVQGTAESGTTVKIFFNGLFDGQRVAAGDGSWSYTPTTKSEGLYYVTARALRSGEETGDTVPVVINLDHTAPLPPTKIRTTAYGNAVDVEWDASPSPDVAGYMVYRREVGETSWVLLTGVKLVAGTKYRDSTVGSGRRYSFKVTAVDDAKPD